MSPKIAGRPRVNSELTIGLQGLGSKMEQRCNGAANLSFPVDFHDFLSHEPVAQWRKHGPPFWRITMKCADFR
jgi:hypothetical protein